MNSLERFDDAFAEAFAKPEAATIPSSSVVPNGIFTIRFPCGSHRTFRIFTKAENATYFPGMRLIAMLIGPDNASLHDYENFGFVDDTGIRVWKRFQNQGPKHKEYAALLWALATGCEADGHELMVSKRCLRCNRTLSTPESLESGLGPECREKLGG